MRLIGGVIAACLPRGRWRLPGNVLRRVLRVEHVLVQNKPDNRVVGKRWPALGTGEWPRGRHDVVGKRWPALGTGEWPRGRHDVVGKRWPALGTGPISTGARSPRAG